LAEDKPWAGIHVVGADLKIIQNKKDVKDDHAEDGKAAESVGEGEAVGVCGCHVLILYFYEWTCH